jgi:hypothetical protein
VLSLTLSTDWLIHQLDVKNAFINGTLTETVYAGQPSGFIDPKFPDKVCRLNKSLYGLKASRAWFQRFASFIVVGSLAPSPTARCSSIGMVLAWPISCSTWMT